MKGGVGDLDAHARPSGDSHETIFNLFPCEEIFKRRAVFAPQETGHGDLMTIIGERGWDVDAFAAWD
jgi:hypothetical protein